MAPKKTTAAKTCSSNSVKTGRQFIDNWSHYLSLSDHKLHEVIEMVNTLDDLRRKWSDSETENGRLKDRVVELENQNEVLTSENSEVKNRLLHCQNELAGLVNKKRNLEDELCEMRKMFDHARSILKDESEAAAHELGKIFKNNNNRSPSRRLGDVNNVNVNNSVNFTTNVHRCSRLAPIIDDKENSGSETHSDIDYDKTAESMDDLYEPVPFRRVSRKRRSRSLAPDPSRISGITSKFAADVIEEEVEQTTATPSKRSKNLDNNGELIAHTTIKLDMSGQRKPSATVTIRRSMNRSMSESTLPELTRARMRPTVPRGGAVVASSSTDLRSPNPSWTDGKPIDRRTHRVTSFRPIFDFCDVCNKNLGLSTQHALRCLVCQIKFHRHCQSLTPMPCIPKVNTPKPGSKNRATLKQYCPQTHPMVPPVLIRCALALEKDRLSFEGLYRVPGSKESAEKLYNDLLSNKIVQFGQIETEAIASCIKRFLRDLRDSLIPATSYEDFLRAIDINRTQQTLIDCVLDLPAPNRDTLAFFMCHLQKVARHASSNLMPAENLSRVLAPSIVGHSLVVTPIVDNQEVIVRNQCTIVLRLLQLPGEFWDRIIACNMSAILAEEARSPGSQSQYLTITPARGVPHRLAAIAGNRNIDTPKSIRVHGTVASDSSPLIQPISLPGRRNQHLSNLC